MAVDLRHLDPRQPRGPARYAAVLASLIQAQAPQHAVQVWHSGVRADERAVDVVITLDGSPPSLRRPSVVAVYDLSHLVAGRLHRPLPRIRRNFSTALLSRRATHLLAPSRGTAHALSRYLRVPDQRLSWLNTIGPGWMRPPRREVEAVRESFRLRRPYFLFVGTLSRRKNLSTLAAAWDVARHHLGDQVDLVAAGAGNRQEAADLLAAGGRWLGYVPDAQLPALIAGALAWVSPSLYEGCSIGVTEAMACGVPAAVAEGTALAEVVGNAGLVLEAKDVQAWASALQELAGDRQARNRMALRALRAAADLRAEDAAARALAAAERAATAWR